MTQVPGLGLGLPSELTPEKIKPRFKGDHGISTKAQVGMAVGILSRGWSRTKSFWCMRQTGRREFLRMWRHWEFGGA